VSASTLSMRLRVAFGTVRLRLMMLNPASETFIDRYLVHDWVPRVGSAWVVSVSFPMRYEAARLSLRGELSGERGEERRLDRGAYFRRARLSAT
jgi:hypothetical protein